MLLMADEKRSRDFHPAVMGLSASGLYRAIFENSESGLAIFRSDDFDISIRLLNPAARRMTGLRSRCHGQSLTLAIKPQSARTLGNAIRRCVESNRPVKLREWLEFPGGRQYWIAVLTPLGKPEDGATNVLLTGRDATEDQDLASRARRSELLTERVATTSPGSVYLFDCATLDYRFLGNTHSPDPSLSAALCEGQEIRLSESRLHADDIQSLRISRERLGRSPEGVVTPALFRLDDGRGNYRWIQCREMVLTRNESGSPSAIVGVAIDVTETVEAKDRLRALSERLMSVQNEERRRIAQDLHDSTAQHLTAIGLGAARLRDLLDGAPKSIAVIDDMEEMLGEAHREIRALTYLLHPPRLGQDGLNASLREFLQGFGRRAGLCIEFVSRGPIDQICRGWETGPFRIVQEAISNVHRHAKATRAEVVVEGSGNRIDLVITDNGRGLSPGFDQKAGLGIDGMRTRAAVLGGRLDITSEMSGTTIRTRLIRPQTLDG